MKFTSVANLTELMTSAFFLSLITFTGCPTCTVHSVII